MQDYNNMSNSLGEVQRIIGLSLSKIQIGRNQRGGLPLHKNLLVATVLNKARDLYMQETMYMNYKMMTGQLGAQMTCNTTNMISAAAAAAAAAVQEQQRVSEEPSVPPEAEDYEEDSESDVEDDSDSSFQQQRYCQPHFQQQQHFHHRAEQPADQPHAPTPPTTSDEGFIDEPDCDCDARNFSSEKSRVPFRYCYQCAPFHPSNGRGPTLVPASRPSPVVGSSSSASTSTASSSSARDSDDEEDDPSNNSVTAGDPNFTIYDMDSKESRPSKSSSHSAARKRRLSDSFSESSNGEDEGDKRRRLSSDSEAFISHSSDEVDTDVSHNENIHPAFRTRQSVSNPADGPQPSSMEIDQITSLVSIFSFGQQIMAAAAAASAKSDNNKLVEEDAKKEEDSDSESDTSSDSGHSSDDHEASTDEKTGETKLAPLHSMPETPCLKLSTSETTTTTASS